jgi:hypothetical protein
VVRCTSQDIGDADDAERADSDGDGWCDD